MESIPNILEDTAQKVNGIIKKPEKFLNKDEDLFEKTKLLSKVVYDVGKLIETECSKRTMPELVIDNFDSEQVWAGIQLQNNVKIEKFETKFSLINLNDLSKYSLLLGKPKKVDNVVVTPEVDIPSNLDESEAEDFDPLVEEEEQANEVESLDDGDKIEEEEGEDLLNDPDFQNMSDSDGDDLPLFGNLSDEEIDEDGEGTFKERERSGGGKKTEVDDKFFKLSEMEKFLDSEDKKEEMKGKTPESDDEDLLDLFEDIPEGDEKRVMYKEYFDRKQALYNEADEADEDEADEDDADEEETDEESSKEDSVKPKSKQKLLDSSEDEENDEVPKSSHEIAQERLDKKISRLEEVAVGEKPWQMGGEVAAPVRPENSLLSEHLDYDTAVRHAPVVTEDVARKLDDIIRQRVKDKAWDDVERKVKPIEDPREYKKKLVLDQEKSKLSLAQVYEEEYIRLAESATPKTGPTVGLLDKDEEEALPELQDIKDMMNILFRKLDSLTHLHYTPKSKSAELKIVRNIPSLAMEEVAPVSASNATLLAPDEVVEKKKGELVDNAEKTDTDKKRDRREKKAAKRAAKKERERKEALVEKLNPGLGNKYSKEKAMKKLELAEKQGKVVTIKGGNEKSVKSSVAFFNNLQDEVKSQVQGKSKEKNKKKQQKSVNLANLKM